MIGYRSSHGNERRDSNPWLEDTLEKEIKRLKEEKKHLEEVSREILKRAKETKKRLKRGTSSPYRLHQLTRNLPEMRNRHHNISIRIEKLEWDLCNIVEIIDKDCKYDNCDCKKINFIRFPKYYIHYAKEECSKCGRWQKFVAPPT